MATLQQIGTFAFGNDPFKQKFVWLRLQVAWEVNAEANGGSTAQRQAWKLKIFNNKEADLEREYLWFLGNSTISGTFGSAAPATTDAQQVQVVRDLVNAWAAVT